MIDVNQAPIGRTPRSNPATYTGVLDGIRQLFSQVPEARVRGYGKGRFSFNVKGGRCEACQGDGILRIEMHFLPDSSSPARCAVGKRYNRETLEITLQGPHHRRRARHDGRGGARLHGERGLRCGARSRRCTTWGSTTSTSGSRDDALRAAKPSASSSRRSSRARATGRTLYLLDEPTTGLHFADVEKLLDVLNRLVDLGNSVVVIEHHPDVIKQADHVIDLCDL